MDNVAVIVVTYNGMKWIERCFSNLYKSVIPLNVYVVDNGSSDGTVEFIEKHYKNIILIKSNRNLGFGKANNLGLEIALEDEYDYFFLLNQDGYVMPETIQTLVAFARENPSYGVVSPIHLNGKGTSLDRNFATLMNNANCAGFVNDIYFNKLKSSYRVNFVMAAFWLVTNSAIQKVGLFNPIFPHYGEDNDYLNRLSYHGMHACIVPQSIALHDREFRETSKSKEIYASYIDLLVRMSDLNRNGYMEGMRAVGFFTKKIFQSIMSPKDLVLHCRNFYQIIFKQSWGIFAERHNNKK